MLNKLLDFAYNHNRSFATWVNSKASARISAFKRRSKAQKKAKVDTEILSGSNQD